MTSSASTLDDREPINGAVDRAQADRAQADRAQADQLRWTRAGLDLLTGTEHGPALGPPAGLVDRLDSMTERLRAASAELGREVRIDGLETLSMRARAAGLHRRGQVSCGGSCHLVRAADGWFAVSLCRADDWELLPAWIGLPTGDPDEWEAVHERCRTLRRDDVVSRGAVLGLPIGALPNGARPDGALSEAALSDGVIRSTSLAPLGAGTPRRSIDGLRVADLSSMWAGPLCGSVLAAAGADVMKVESVARPDGTRSGPPAVFDALNGTKEEVLIDFGTDEGIRQLEMLLRSVDVVIESTRPRALRHLGIDADRLLADAGGPNVWISITGYGRQGDDANRAAFGDDAAVSGGLVCWSNEEPIFCADAIADPLTGLTAAAAALETLLDPRPALLDVAMSRVAAHFARP